MGGPFDIPEKVGIDAYTMRARIQPAMLVALPLALVVLVLDPTHLLLGKVAWTVAAWAGGTALVAQLARDRGKAREEGLYRAWGGKPTTKALRHSGATNPTLLSRRHSQIQRLIPNIHLPTLAEERRDPLGADASYESCATFLRDQTRDRSRFPLVFEENCNYGFRRNVWGLKPFGVLTAVIAAAACGVALARTLGGATGNGITAEAGALALCLLIVAVWIFVVTESWVRIPAEAYAERLLEATDSLP